MKTDATVFDLIEKEHQRQLASDERYRVDRFGKLRER